MIPQRYFSFFLVTLIVGLALSCNRVKPKPPQAGGYDSAIAPARSFLAGPITFRIRSLEDKINAALKPEIVNTDDIKGSTVSLRVVRTGRVQLHYANQRVTFSAPITVWLDNPLRLNKKKRATHPLCKLSVQFQSPLQVSSDWRLSTKVKFVNYTWLEKPKVRILGINIPVQRIAEKALDKRRNYIETTIDNAVHDELRLDKQVRPVWLDLQKPLLITKKPDTLWIVPTPFSVAVGDVTGTETTLTIPIRVAFYTSTHLGPKPVVAVNRALPAVRKDHHIRQVSDIHVLSLLPYSDINRVLTKALENQEIKLIAGSLKVKKASVYGAQHALIIRTDVAGTVKGVLYFRGQPAYDTLSNTLLIRHIDFDVETEERLLQTADWLLHDRLKDTLQQVLHIPLRTQVLSLPGLIGRAFESGKVGRKNDLAIQSFRFVPQRFAIRPEGIQILLKVEAKAAFSVNAL